MAKLTLATSLTKMGMALTAVSVGIAVSSGSANAATVLLNDNFDSENGGVRSLNYNRFANWNVSNGTVDLIAENQFLTGNGQLVDLDGSTNDAGKLESKATFVFNPGDIVNLSFKLAGSQRFFGSSTDTAIVSLGNLFQASYTLPPTQKFINQNLNFTINSSSPISAKLSFEGTGGDNIGLLLDDVNLSVEPVPEPFTILGSLTAGAFGIAFRRQSKKQGKVKGSV